MSETLIMSPDIPNKETRKRDRRDLGGEEEEKQQGTGHIFFLHIKSIAAKLPTFWIDHIQEKLRQAQGEIEWK